MGGGLTDARRAPAGSNHARYYWATRKGSLPARNAALAPAEPPPPPPPTGFGLGEASGMPHPHHRHWRKGWRGGCACRAMHRCGCRRCWCHLPKAAQPAVRGKGTSRRCLGGLVVESTASWQARGFRTAALGHIATTVGEVWRFCHPLAPTSTSAHKRRTGGDQPLPATSHHQPPTKATPWSALTDRLDSYRAAPTHRPACALHARGRS